MMNQQKKKVIKRGALPFHLRSELSNHLLRKYPQYKHIFKKCPICGKNSLKPLGLNKVDRITEVLDLEERRCTKCPYTHVPNLVVSTEPSSKAAIEGRILL